MTIHKYYLVIAKLGEQTTPLTAPKVIGDIKIPMKGDFPRDDANWDTWTGLEKSLKDGVHMLKMPYEDKFLYVRAVSKEIIEDDGS